MEEDFELLASTKAANAWNKQTEGATQPSPETPSPSTQLLPLYGTLIQKSDVENIGSWQTSAPISGDLCTFQVHINQDGIIDETAFLHVGLATTRQALHLISQWLKGCTLSQALEIRTNDIIQALNLPPDRSVSAILARDVIDGMVTSLRKQQSNKKEL